MSSQGKNEERAWVWSTWVKTPMLENAELLIASACLPLVNPELYRKLSENRVVLLACPERESAAYYGKLASIVRSSRPKRIIVATVDGSPHCFALQAAVNEAEYILGERIEREHYVVVNAKELVQIKPDAVRVARYLSIVNKLVEKDPSILSELAKRSKEYLKSLELANSSNSEK